MLLSYLLPTMKVPGSRFSFPILIHNQKLQLFGLKRHSSKKNDVQFLIPHNSRLTPSNGFCNHPNWLLIGLTIGFWITDFGYIKDTPIFQSCLRKAHQVPRSTE